MMRIIVLLANLVFLSYAEAILLPFAPTEGKENAIFYLDSENARKLYYLPREFHIDFSRHTREEPVVSIAYNPFTGRSMYSFIFYAEPYSEEDFKFDGYRNFDKPHIVDARGFALSLEAKDNGGDIVESFHAKHTFLADMNAGIHLGGAIPVRFETDSKEDSLALALNFLSGGGWTAYSLKMKYPIQYNNFTARFEYSAYELHKELESTLSLQYKQYGRADIHQVWGKVKERYSKNIFISAGSLTGESEVNLKALLDDFLAREFMNDFFVQKDLTKEMRVKYERGESINENDKKDLIQGSPILKWTFDRRKFEGSEQRIVEIKGNLFDYLKHTITLKPVGKLPLEVFPKALVGDVINEAFKLGRPDYVDGVILEYPQVETEHQNLLKKLRENNESK